MRPVVVLFLILGTPALAQQADKLLPWVQMQRNGNADAVAQCSVIVNDQQAKIADLEKQIADLKAQK